MSLKIRLAPHNRRNFTKVARVASAILPGAVHGGDVGAWDLVARCLLAGGTVEIRS